MTEKIFKKNKNGMRMLILSLALYVLSVIAIVGGAIAFDSRGSKVGLAIMIIGIVYAALGWILFLGLKVLKPQEALVLTLFGNYIGTIKEPGFYFVNPFCTAVNPAADTKLNQSGDVKSGMGKLMQLNTAEGVSAEVKS